MKNLRSGLPLFILFIAVGSFLAGTYSYRRVTDTELNSFQTRALVLHGDVDLNRFPRAHSPAFFALNRNGHRYSIYGVGVSVVAAPIYAVLARVTSSEPLLQGAVAIPFVAAAIVLMYLCLSRLVNRTIALAGTIVFGFGTTMWPLASMALFQHGPVAFFQVLGLIGLFANTRRAPALAGAGLGMALFIRPTTAIGFGVVALYYLTTGVRRSALFALGSAVPIAGILIQNRWIWGTWWTGGYSHSGVAFDGDIPSALWGLTFGLWRGVFVYSPVLIVAVAGMVMACRNIGDGVARRLAALGLGSIGTLLFYSRWSTWHNGFNQFGYRYLLDIVPFLIVLGSYAVARSERVRSVAMPLAALSIMTTTLGAAPNNFGLDGVPFATKLEDTSLGQAWTIFIDRPDQGLIRLLGVTLIALMFVRFAPPSEHRAPA